MSGKPFFWKVVFLFWLVRLPVATADDAVALVQRAVGTVCDHPLFDLTEMAADIPGTTAIAEESIETRGVVIGWKRRFTAPGRGEIRLERIAPGGELRRLIAEYRTPMPEGGTRPELAAVADASCRIRTGRRLLYTVDQHSAAVEIEHLDDTLNSTGTREPLNPPLPPGTDPGGVLVGLVDAGVNYLLPDVEQRLARDGDGGILGYDFWDMDQRPFDANPAQSPFFPQRHGTKTASLLLSEAPAARLVPYRYPRPDMTRMTQLVEDAAAKGIVIINMSMGSNKRSDWEAFAAAAKAHPDILFVVSAGNNGRDIDALPVYPAALRLDNAIVVTSSEDNGQLAPGSNWGQVSVDLMVPAERLIVTDFDGQHRPASGSSYAAIRVSALAARFLAEHPEWRAAELMSAIFARTLPGLSTGNTRVAKGFIPRPDRAEQLPSMSQDGDIQVIERHVLTSADLYPVAPTSPGFSLRPTLLFFEKTAWTLDNLQQHGREAAAILARCDIQVPEIDVRVLSGPVAYRYFHDSISPELVKQTAPPKPAVYFIKDTLQTDAYDAEAIGKGNSATRPALRDTVWFTEATRDPGVALAHELSHLLMNDGRHVKLPGNLMRADTAPDNTELTDEQCKAMIDAGTENGLLIQAG